ncbi:Phytochrome, two-component sensor histidine kinase [hydrothermal vent metagenome]|uniref:Diguanylate cyclase DosC n=1 Tax=hydrothermal vent metagenome TaxID=652676 RepID=A0A3B1BC01_9ZZZZ
MMRTDQTLLEQMKISDVDIINRMDVLALSKEELQILSSHQKIIDDNIDIIVEEFYEKQIEIEEISLVIGDADTLLRLRNAQRRYVIDLFSGYYDREYVNNRLRIGMIHKRIGVDPRLYLSAIRTLKNIVNTVLKRNIKANSILEMTLDALDKLIYFDTTLVFDAYIDSLVREVESAKRKTEAYAEGLEEKVAERTKQLEEQAKTDSLTGIYNQRAMHEILRRELSVSHRRQTVLSFVYFDIDNFKAINDKLGHIEGDDVLKYIGKIMKKIVREVDVPCRYGGDEFCLILPDCANEDAEIICQRLIEAFNEVYPEYTLSIGISEASPLKHVDSMELINIADGKMYLAKKETGSNICN